MTSSSQEKRVESRTDVCNQWDHRKPGEKNSKRQDINMGFLAIDKLAEKHDIKVNKLKHKALTGDGFLFGSEKALLSKASDVYEPQMVRAVEGNRQLL